LSLSVSMEKLSVVHETLCQVGHSVEITKENIEKLAQNSYQSFDSVTKNILFALKYFSIKLTFLIKLQAKVDSIEERMASIEQKNKSAASTPLLKPITKKIKDDEDEDEDLVILDDKQNNYHSLKRTRSKIEVQYFDDDDDVLPNLEAKSLNAPKTKCLK